MSFSLVLCWSLIRALVVSSVGLWIFYPLRDRVNCNNATGTIKWLSVLAVLPLLMPDLLLGFTYRLLAASLNFSNTATELIYGLLLLTKVLGVQFICEWLVPAPTVSPSSIHLWKKTNQKSWRGFWIYLRLLLAGPYRSLVVGWTLGALWCFQEFETAALLQIEQHPVAWSVWLFDAKAANEPLANCLMLACPAIIIQGTLITFCLATLNSAKAGGTPNQHFHPHNQSTSVQKHVSHTVVALGFLFAVAWPLIWNTSTGIRGLWELIESTTLRRESRQIAQSTFVAGLSAVASWMLVRQIFSTRSRGITLAATLPGLLSPLVLSLLCLGLFLQSPFRAFYDSLLPLVIAQTVWLLPRALLLCVAFDRRIKSEQIHSARLLLKSDALKTRKNAGKLMWVLRDRPAWIAVTVLLMMAFWEVTMNSILHPVSLQPTVCLLYRQMHFGHTEVLAGLTALSIIFPLLTLVVLAQIWKLVKQ